MNDSSGNLYLRFGIVLMDSAGKVVLSTFTKKVLRLHHLINSREWSKAVLKVSYSPDEMLVNEGEYDTLADLQQAISAFSDPELRRYIAGQT